MQNQDKIGRILSMTIALILYTIKKKYTDINTCYSPSDLGEQKRSKTSPHRPLSFSIQVWVCFQDKSITVMVMSPVKRHLTPVNKEYFQPPSPRVYKVCNRFKISNMTLEKFGLKIDQTKGG